MKKTILIIEDDQFLRELYAEVLKDEGYEIKEEVDGSAGLAAMERGGFDLVLLDVMLPKMDGLEILKKLKEEDKLTKKPIFLLTNLSAEAIADKNGRIEADEYIVKSSITPDELIGRVKKYLG